MLAELEKLETNLGGVADMRRLPDAICLIDMRKEQLAVREARRLKIPVIGLVDTNCDPDDADLVIPGNDDAIRCVQPDRPRARGRDRRRRAARGRGGVRHRERRGRAAGRRHGPGTPAEPTEALGR